MVEISLAAPLDARDLERVQAALAPLVSQVMLNVGGWIITVRALNAVGTLPAILDALEAIDPLPSLGEPLKSGKRSARDKSSGVRVRENTLEDVFIQLTGRRLRE